MHNSHYLFQGNFVEWLILFVKSDHDSLLFMIFQIDKKEERRKKTFWLSVPFAWSAFVTRYCVSGYTADAQGWDLRVRIVSEDVQDQCLRMTWVFRLAIYQK